MSELLPQTALTALRSTTEGTPRLATSGLASPGDVAGRFASMLAGLRDGDTATAAPGAINTSTATASDTLGGSGAGEHRVGMGAVSLLMESSGQPASQTASDVDDDTPRRKRPAVADVSGQVVQTAIDAGLHSDGRWMATLLAVG